MMRLSIDRRIAASVCLASIAACFIGGSALGATVPGGAGTALRLARISPRSPIAADTVLHLSIELRGNDRALAEFMRGLYDPGSQNYHAWLTPQQFGARFGASNAEIADVERWATAAGMKVTTVWPNRRFLSATILAGAAQSALDVRIHEYHPVGTPGVDAVYAPDREPTVPDQIAGDIVSIHGLTNALFAVRPRTVVSRAVAEGAAAVPDTVSPLLNPLSPAELSTIYDLSRLQSAGFTGTGYKIGVFSPTLYHSSDVQTFESYYNIHASLPLEEWPSSTGRATDYSGADEAALDVEVAIGQAPAAQVVLYEAPNNGTSAPDEFNQMAADNPQVVSFSYSFPEYSSDQAGVEQLDAIVEQMAAQGMTVIAASGDSGPFDNGGTTPSVAYPASSIYATGVGGTALPNSNGGYWYDETAWNDSTGTTGGGNSLFFSRPSWQAGPGVINSQSDGMRQVPDVSSLAGSPGINIYSSGQWQSFGGTSASAPFWAASLTDFDQALGGRHGNYSPELYAFADNPTTYANTFHDIVSGSDQLFSCTPGWDYLTGLGSADMYELYLQFAGAGPVHAFPSGLQMIAVPYQYATPSLGGLFDNTPTLAVYQPATGVYAVTPSPPADSIRAGIGYWVNVAEPLNLVKAGTSVTATPFKVALSSGWNMVGDPYSTPTAISSIQVAPSGAAAQTWAQAVSSNIVGGTVYTYPAGATQYSAIAEGSDLEPYTGYWIDAFKSCTLEF